MTKTRNTTSGKALALALTALAFASADASGFQSASDRLILRGVARDFRSDHADFAISPPDGFGHTPGNVSWTLSSGRKPVYTGQGFKAAAQWRDSQTQPIAPHLYNQSGWDYWTWKNAGVGIGDSLDVSNNGFVDSWDSTQGTYVDTQGVNAFLAMNTGDVSIDKNSMIGGTLFLGPGEDTSVVADGGQIIGNVSTLDEPGVMPTIIVPNVGPSVGNIVVPVGGFLLMDKSVHCDSLRLRSNAVLAIENDVTLVCDGAFTMNQNTRIRLRPGATLKVYTSGRVDVVDQNAYINRNTEDPSRVLWYHLSSDPFNLQNNSEVFATIMAPKAEVRIDQNGHAYGKVMADSVWIGNNAGLHVDTASSGFPTICGVLVKDQAGLKGVFSKGAVTSAYTFGQWYRDVPGVNASKKHDLHLRRMPDGMYEFGTDSFYPLDGDLYGNEGSAHNNYFTYEAPATFTYEACAGQKFIFQGDDDAWIFVNGKLVIDLGGMIPNVPQVIELDRLGLTDGEIYDFNFFYAQRQGKSARFRMRTNINLVPEPYTVGVGAYPSFD